MDCVFIRYNEIALKGKNRGQFEARLVENIRAFLKKEKIEKASVRRGFGRIIIKTDSECRFLSKVFGIHSYSQAYQLPLEIERIRQKVLEVGAAIKKSETFRISVQRVDKDYPLQSMEMERMFGADLVQKYGLKVNLERPNKEIGIDILKGAALIWTDRVNGPGGLPVGIEGNVICLLEDHNSLEAAILMLKRGCDVMLASKVDFDYTNLLEYFPGNPKFFKIKGMEDIEKIARDYQAKALVVSQTLESLKEIQSSLLVLRPLIAQ